MASLCGELFPLCGQLRPKRAIVIVFGNFCRPPRHCACLGAIRYELLKLVVQGSLLRIGSMAGTVSVSNAIAYAGEYVIVNICTRSRVKKAADNCLL